MANINRCVVVAVFAILAALPVAANAIVVDAALAARQAEFFRLHESAVAFVDTVGKTSYRYRGLGSTDLNHVRKLIAQSEQAALRQDFDAASKLARQAYELLGDQTATAFAGRAPWFDRHCAEVRARRRGRRQWPMKATAKNGRPTSELVRG